MMDVGKPENGNFFNGQKRLPAREVVDPLSHIFMKRFLFYIILLIILLLWPFDLFKPNHVFWLSGTNGIEFIGDGVVVSSTPIPDLCRELITGSGLTLEVWLSVGNTYQSGPARILSYSLNHGYRNFTIGQQGKDLVIRLRTTETSLNGMNPHLVVENVFNSLFPIHIAVTYDFFCQTVFINGVKRIQRTIPTGKFTNWHPSHYLIFGNEVNCNRPWHGKLFGAEIYNRPLAEDEIIENYKSGRRLSSNSSSETQGVTEGLLIRYLFDEGQGDTIRNSVSGKTSKDLNIPRTLRNITSSYLRWPYDSLQHTLKSQDTILNVLGFIPFGFFLHGMIRNRQGLSWKLSVVVLFAGAIISFSFESLQYFSVDRDSSTVDLLSNTLGTIIGIMIDRSYIRHVRHYWSTKPQS